MKSNNWPSVAVFGVVAIISGCGGSGSGSGSVISSRVRAISLYCAPGSQWSQCQITWSNGQIAPAAYVDQFGYPSQIEPKGDLVESETYVDLFGNNSCLKLWENGGVRDCSYNAYVGPWEQMSGSDSEESTISDLPDSQAAIPSTSTTYRSTTTTTLAPLHVLVDEFRPDFDYDFPIDPKMDGYAFRIQIRADGRNSDILTGCAFVDNANVDSSFGVWPGDSEFKGFTKCTEINGESFHGWIYLPELVKNPEPESQHQIFVEFTNKNSMKSRSHKFEFIYSANDSNGRPWGYGNFRWRFLKIVKQPYSFIYP